MEDTMFAPTNSTSRRATRKQGRLSELLAHREDVGTQWAERASHGLPGLGELTEQLMVVELAITEQWPKVSEAWLGEWVVSDARKLHDPDTGPYEACAICARSSRQAAA